MCDHEFARRAVAFQSIARNASPSAYSRSDSNSVPRRAAASCAGPLRSCGCARAAIRSARPPRDREKRETAAPRRPSTAGEASPIAFSYQTKIMPNASAPRATGVTARETSSARARRHVDDRVVFAPLQRANAASRRDLRGPAEGNDSRRDTATRASLATRDGRRRRVRRRDRHYADPTPRRAGRGDERHGARNRNDSQRRQPGEQAKSNAIAPSR